MLGGLKQSLCAPGPRDPTEAEPELCLSVSSMEEWASSATGQKWPARKAGALVATDLGMA